MLNRYFHQIRINYLEEKLSQLPNISIGNHLGEKIVRLYYSDGKKNEYKLSSPKGQAALKLIGEYEKYSELFKKYQSDWFAKYKKTYKFGYEFIISSNKIARIPIDHWDSIKRCAKPESEKSIEEYKYSHNNIKMRSRFEILTAEVLDSMDLEYVYESRVSVDNKTMYPDFIVAVPELGCCFIIECLGMMDSRSYYSSNMNKINSYLGVGFVLGRDIIFLMGGEKMMPDSCQMRAQINSVLDYLCYTLLQ